MTCLAEDEDVGLDAVVVAGEHAAGARAAGLHLVADQQRVVRVQQLLRAAQVALVRDHDARLALRACKQQDSHTGGLISLRKAR